MEKLKKFWYNLVCPSLVDEMSMMRLDLVFAYKDITSFREEIKDLRSHIKTCERTISEQGRTISALKRDPLNGCIDSASRRASQVRIRDLENQLKKNGIEPQ